ncbi:MAG: hypothetical protein WBV78_11250 [Roseobacter sp.]
MRQIFITGCALIVMAATNAANAEPPQIDNVSARQSSDGTWRFDVTISHPDTGWDHYADGWRVLDMDGNQLGMRVLHHPHVEEQPFTRSLSGVRIPEGVRQVQVQARDKPDGWNADTKLIMLP